MAYTKSISRHSNVKQLIDYVLNPKKTEKLLNTASLNCNFEYAHKQFDVVQRFYHANKKYKSKSKSLVNAFHVIQSFDKYDNITPELALEIGKQFAREKFGDTAQIVIATHNDTDKIHNHIVVNSVRLNGKKIYSNINSWHEMTRISDRLCKEHGLSVIKNKQYNSIHYKEHMERKKGTSWKENFRVVIDKAILVSGSFEEFKENLRKLDYEVREDRKIHLSVKTKGYEGQYMRTHRLGSDYTQKRIIERILSPHKHMVEAGGQRITFATFVNQKRREYNLADMALALQYLSVLEILFRLIVNNLFREQKKWDIRRPYTIMNDFYFRRVFNELLVVEKSKAKTKASVDKLQDKGKLGIQCLNRL